MDEAAQGQDAGAAAGAADAAAGEPAPAAETPETAPVEGEAPAGEAAALEEAPAEGEAPMEGEAPQGDAPPVPPSDAPAEAGPAAGAEAAAGDTPTPPPSDFEVIEQGQNPGEGQADAAQTATTGQPDKLPVDELAQLDQDKTVLFFGTIPLIAITVLALACIAIYFFRRGKNWNDLGEAMRLDPENEPKEHSGFSTRELQDLDPTKPSQRLSKASKLDEKEDT